MLKRLAATAALGTIAGLSLAGPAYAGPEVVFTASGVPGLLCGSKPSTSSITVGANASVSLTNSLGGSAALLIDGANSATVNAGQTVQVQFHRGPVSIAMKQTSCLLGDAKPLTVQVTPAPPAQPTPTRPASAPTSTSPRPSTKPPAPATSQPEMPALPSLPGDLFHPADEAAVGTVPPGSDTLKTPPASVLGESGTRDAVADAPIDKGPIGLLAIIATVCVVGVTAGAIRAIITQRATRAEFA